MSTLIERRPICSALVFIKISRSYESDGAVELIKNKHSKFHNAENVVHIGFEIFA